MADGTPRKVIVNERAAKRLRNGHVWVYASDVLNDAGANPGALVHVIGPKDKILGSAIYSSSSQIKLRLLGREALRTEEELLQLVRQRLAEAISYRSKVVQNSDACRLVFSEADRLPGLIVDRYNDVFTFQVLTQAWDAPERKKTIIDGLKEFAGAKNIVERADARIRELEQLPEMESVLIEGQKSSTIFTMNGVKFHYDALSGQKTGAFLDQRENYAAAA
jgi:23S rRNA (cytosine1962-C5)-methyltransferase